MSRACLMLVALLTTAIVHAEPASVFFPAESAGGKVRFFSVTGAVVFAGDDWVQYEAGKVFLPLKWQDTKDDRRIAISHWSFRLPAGRFILTARNDGETITYLLTREGDKQPMLKSEPAKILALTRE